jgi:putative ABC transport system permease protein
MKPAEIIDILKEATKNLRREGVRTFLTLIGVVIGIAAIVSLLSIGSGLSIAVEEQFKSLGTNTIFVIPQGYGNMKISLGDSDIKAIESVSGVESVVPIYTSSAMLEFNGQKINVSVESADAKKAAIFDNTGYFDVQDGRNFYQNESGAVLIGDNIANEYFDKKINVGKQILINGETYKVIGILKKQAQSFGGGPSTGGAVFMSLDAFRRITESPSPTLIFAKTYTASDATDAADAIKKKLEKVHGDGSILAASAESLLNQVNSILGLVTIFLVGIAGISLVVGGVGIMNAMITSVMERTKEIGVMKALGASNNKVLAIFILEAAFIGAIGGIIGMIIGFTLSSIISEVGKQLGYGLTAAITPEIAIGALFFSMIVGMASGFYPALRAARMDPVVALRYS